MERRREERRSSFWDDDGGFRAEGDYGYSRSGRSFGKSERAAYGSYSSARSVKRDTPSSRPKTTLSSPKPASDFKEGDSVVHKAFGPGKIMKMTPMGGDALIEVHFDSGETKKLMLRIAAQHMEKA